VEIQNLSDDVREDREARVVPLLRALHRICYTRTTRSMLAEDKLCLGVRFAQIYLEVFANADVGINEEQFQFLLKGSALTPASDVDDEIVTALELSTVKMQLLENLYSVNGFEELDDAIKNDLDAWKEYVSGADVDDLGWEPKGEGWEVTLQHMCLNKVFRPDRLVVYGRQFTEQVFGWNLNEIESNPDSLMTIVLEQTKAETPLVFASSSGNDPSSKIDNLAAKHFGSSVNKLYTSMAMGSPEGFDEANSIVKKASKNKKGAWVCLKNVHLSPEWLTGLEKTMHRLELNPNFRIFLTMETEVEPGKISTTLLRTASLIIFEPALGVKASLTRTYNSLSAQRVNKLPAERSTLYVVLAWLHAVILERLRFEPYGWTKKYEFSETDLRCACDGIDEWVDKISRGRHNISPAEIPWDALHAMLTQYVYGGRVDNKFDTIRLLSLVTSLFNADVFNKNFPVAEYCQMANDEMQPGRLCYVIPKGTKADIPQPAKIAEVRDDEVNVTYFAPFVIVDNERIFLESEWLPASEVKMEKYEMRPLVTLPNSTKYMDVKKWIADLPDEIVGSPVVLGLAPRAELMLLEKRVARNLINLLKLQDMNSDEGEEIENLFDDEEEEEEGPGTSAAWMKNAVSSTENWDNILPDSVEPLPQDAYSMKNPLYRFMRREFGIGKNILNKIKADIADVREVVYGEGKASNYVRQLLSDFHKAAVPAEWGLYSVYQVNLETWVRDFCARVKQLNQMAGVDYVNSPHDNNVWLGGVFQPGGFVAATRQYVAQQNKWPLEELELVLDIGVEEITESSFMYKTITLFGAGWDQGSGCVVLTEKTFTALPLSRFRWVLRDKLVDELNDEVTHYVVPVYLNKSMKELLFEVRVKVFKSIPSSVWMQRAVSLTAWTD